MKSLFSLSTLVVLMAFLFSGCASHKSHMEGKADMMDAMKAEMNENKTMAQKALKEAEAAKAEAAAAKSMAQDAMNAANEAKTQAAASREASERMFKTSQKK